MNMLLSIHYGNIGDDIKQQLCNKFFIESQFNHLFHDKPQDVQKYKALSKIIFAFINQTQLIIKKQNTFTAKMLNFLSTLGSDSQFQKNRLLLTKPTYDAPNEQALRNILRTFAGEDEQTRSQIAFATIVKKIHLSSGKENWVYLLKNLIILDRVMSDKRFCQELTQTNLVTVKNYSDKDLKSQAVNGKFLIQKFWQLIQELCRLKVSKQNILYYKRSERKGYLDGLSAEQIFRNIRVLQKLFQMTLSLIFLTSGINSHPEKSERQTQIWNQKHKKYYMQFTSSQLAQYMNIHLYSKLLTLFSCQYLCIHKFIQVILKITCDDQGVLVSIDEAKVFKKMILKFKDNCGDMKILVERNKGKKGFENVDTKEFDAFSDQHILKVVDEYISQQGTQKDNQRLQILASLQTMRSLSPSSSNQKPSPKRFVEKKPLMLHGQGKSIKAQRKTKELRKQQQEQKVFKDYFNSYSQQFPHKSMMTLDLIEDIRRDQQKMYQQILEDAQNYNKCDGENVSAQQQKPKQKEYNFFEQFKHLKSNLKLRDILIYKNDEKQKEEDSTSYSFKNSSRGGSLFDLLNIKWIPQNSQYHNN